MKQFVECPTDRSGGIRASTVLVSEENMEHQSWDLQSMQAAVDAVRSRHLTPSTASDKYNIPRTTAVRNRKELNSRKQDIPPEIEAFLVDHIFLMESRAFGMTIRENLLNENNLFGDPIRIHNADETGLQLNNRPEKILNMKGKRNATSVTAKERL
ncbi:hypothetical protein PR048_011778 [Dryococelus australis]|uniref:HTH psq-type domain-containing protein n=1 Tax=Dryococelus australis TaxID=614101 RepID=A0ABQ9HN18_9NEOP|nr:hypothetical protein PR048_011778 [Dryococelus australis]